MSLVKLSDQCWVDPHQVAEVTVNDSSNTYTVRMRDGVGHCLSPDYGKGVYASAKRIIDEINKACTP